MASVIAFANQKGGVGKTTSAIHIAAALAALHQRVLLCDLDPQGNIASGLGIRKSEIKRSIYDAVIGACEAKDAILATEIVGLSVLPSHLSLVGVESELAGQEGANTAVREMLEPISRDYDYIILDCPPSLSLLTVNALVAATAVVVPMTLEFYALEGLSQLHISIRRVRELYNPRLYLAAVLPTMYNPRLSLTQSVMEELRTHYGDKLLKHPIPRSVKVAEAPGFGKTVFETAPTSSAAVAYQRAAKELLMRI